MKKIIFVLLLVLSIFTFTACMEAETALEFDKLVHIEDKTVLYDGSSYSLSYKSELPGGYVVTFSGEPQTEVGKYPFKVVVSKDGKVVYEKTAYLTIEAPKEEEIKFEEKIVFEDLELTYDGKPHKIELQNYLPEKYNVISDGQTHTEVGTYNYKVVVFLDSEIKYEKTATLTIKAPEKQKFNVRLEFNNQQLNVTADKALTDVLEGTTIKFSVTFVEGYEFAQILLNGTPVNQALVNGEFSLTIDKAYTVEVKAKEKDDNSEQQGGNGEVEEKQKYNVSLTFDNTKLNVTSNHALGEVEEGTVITFTVSINPGFEFSEIKINGQTANIALANGEFRLTIDKAYTIEVIVKEASTDDYVEVTTPWIEG